KETLRQAVGGDLIPINLLPSDLAGWNASKAMRRIMRNVIDRAIVYRNGGRPKTNHFEWKNILTFEYADGAKMTTIGGILVEKGHCAHFDKCGFSSLEFYKPDVDDGYRIEIPALTYRELGHLDRQLPKVEGVVPQGNGIPGVDIEKYQKIYRYFPKFTEAIM
ncbi:MAG: hypothetical protein KF847_11840, partial [Pirellulales bacterium]|nr:hypothetical protein [Pirellulales bacterium]